MNAIKFLKRTKASPIILGVQPRPTIFVLVVLRVRLEEGQQVRHQPRHILDERPASLVLRHVSQRGPHIPESVNK